MSLRGATAKGRCPLGRLRPADLECRHLKPLARRVESTPLHNSAVNRRHILKSLGRAGALSAVTVSGGLGLVSQALAAASDSARTALGYETLEFDWADTARNRAVPVRLYLPRSATAQQPAPLLVFSHGIGGSRRGYTYLAQHWASSGWASLHVQHVGSDRTLWSGGVWTMVGRLHAAAQDAEAIARARDLRFALDELLHGELGARVDGQRVVAAGHSYGANTSLLAAGARVWRDGGPMDLRDPRVKAAILISAPPFYGEGDPRTILGPVEIPTLHITATEDVIRIPGYYSGLEDRLSVFDAIGSPQKWLAVFEGGSHSMFTDRAGTGGALLNPKVKAATRELSSAFLQGVFEGKTQALESWPLQFAPLLARFSARA